MIATMNGAPFIGHKTYRFDRDFEPKRSFDELVVDFRQTIAFAVMQGIASHGPKLKTQPRRYAKRLTRKTMPMRHCWHCKKEYAPMAENQNVCKSPKCQRARMTWLQNRNRKLKREMKAAISSAQ